jgi:hypothetical protein
MGTTVIAGRAARKVTGGLAAWLRYTRVGSDLLRPRCTTEAVFPRLALGSGSVRLCTYVHVYVCMYV